MPGPARHETPERLVMTSSFARISAVVVLLVVASCVFAAEAELPKEGPATTQSVSPSTRPVVTPDAAAVLEKIKDAYTKLKSLELTAHVTGEFDVDGQKKKDEADFTASYAAPNRFRHEAKDEAMVGSTGE